METYSSLPATLVGIAVAAAIFCARFAAPFEDEDHQQRYLWSGFAGILSWPALVFLAASLPNDVLKDLLAPLYLGQVALLVYLFSRVTRGRIADFIKPSMLGLIYIGISVGLGAFMYSIEAVVRSRDLADYMSWYHMAEVYSAVSGSFLIMFLISLWPPRATFGPPPTESQPKGYYTAGVLTVLLFASLPIDHPLMAVPWAVLACSTFFIVFRNKFKWRWLVVALIVGVMAAFAYDSKRNAIFLLLPALLLEARYGSARLNWRWVRIGVPMAFVVGFLIITMSLIRMPNAQRSFTEAAAEVPTYAADPKNLALISNHFELGYMFFHTHNSVQASLQIDRLNAHGLTYLKALFVPVPFGDKPPSYIDLYTRWAEYDFRERGGSWMASALGEPFWNFGIWGFAMLALVIGLLDWVYKHLLRNIGRNIAVSGLALAMITFILQLLRGSGFDIYVAYSMVAAGVAIVVAMVAMTTGGMAISRKRYTYMPRSEVRVRTPPAPDSPGARIRPAGA
ncbi:MAG: hypothetical protein ACK4K7_03000 [Allosphingosinicella sp.]|uniref:hypothetical protein n=1 Tax=Allosphingosinicella sp. TaxID=2823234 RepID=UPI00392D3540